MPTVNAGPLSLSVIAAELGMPLEDLISFMAHDGLLMVLPGTEDPRCCYILPVLDGDVDVRQHVADCGCEFVPGPHPDLVEVA